MKMSCFCSSGLLSVCPEHTTQDCSVPSLFITWEENLTHVFLFIFFYHWTLNVVVLSGFADGF